MALFKKKLELPEYLFYWLNALASAKTPDLDAADPKKELDVATRDKITAELRYFVYALTTFWLLEMQAQGQIQSLKPGQVSDDNAGKEIGYGQSRMLEEVLKQKGMSQEAVQAEVVNVGNAITDYITAIGEVPENELHDKGAFFFACEHFKKRILGRQLSHDEKGLDIQFLVFDIARQVYRNTEVAFKRFNSDVRVV